MDLSSQYSDPFAYISDPWRDPHKIPRVKADTSLDKGFPRKLTRVRELAQHMSNGTWELSQSRAKICAMNNDAISAAMWSLSGFDPALVHLAELREKFAHLDPEEDPIRITLDRLTSVYVEGQCQTLLEGAGITTNEANTKVEQMIGDPSDVALHVLACSSDPLAMELFGYALWLGSLTAHGKAPWNRYAAVMADCYHQKHFAVAGG